VHDHLEAAAVPSLVCLATSPARSSVIDVSKDRCVPFPWSDNVEPMLIADNRKADVVTRH
jgi:hypothetical protein